MDKRALNLGVHLSYDKQLTLSGSSSSKGNQPKWKMGVDWYKGDYMGYEGLAEVYVSEMLKHSSVNSYVKYYPVDITCGDNFYTGCFSLDFLDNYEELITIERLHVLTRGKPLAKELDRIPSIKNKILYTVSFLEEETGLKGVGEYLTALLELDALFLNEDRHTNNIAIIRNTKTKQFRFCPYFDFGLSLLSDTSAYPLNHFSVEKAISSVKAKPFSSSFDSQVSAARSLYGSQVRFNLPNRFLLDLKEKYQSYYDTDVLNRAVETLIYQISHNKDMF